MPLSLLLLLRAGVTHLGAELALLGDLTCHRHFQSEMSGIRGYCFITLKVCLFYNEIILINNSFSLKVIISVLLLISLYCRRPMNI